MEQKITPVFIIAILLFCVCSCSAPADPTGNDTSGNTHADTTTVDAFNPQLAQTYGADDYGMKQYVMAFLKAGPNRSQDSLTRANLQSAHLANISRLAEEGKLLVAGPFLDGGEVRGIYIFNVTNIEEAKKLTETDPAIQAGSLVMELRPWYGSAGLMKVTEIHGMLPTKEC